MKTLVKQVFLLALILGCLNTVKAQKTKAEKKAAEEAAIKKMVIDTSYIFKATYVTPQRGGGRALTDDYDLVVSKDTIKSFLPYFGRAYTSNYGSSDGGIKFTSTKFDYTITPNKKGGWEIIIKPKEKNTADMRDVQSLRLTIGVSGYASLNVTSTNRDAISFQGNIEARNKK